MFLQSQEGKLGVGTWLRRRLSRVEWSHLSVDEHEDTLSFSLVKGSLSFVTGTLIPGLLFGRHVFCPFFRSTFFLQLNNLHSFLLSSTSVCVTSQCPSQLVTESLCTIIINRIYLLLWLRVPSPLRPGESYTVTTLHFFDDEVVGW